MLYAYNSIYMLTTRVILKRMFFMYNSESVTIKLPCDNAIRVGFQNKINKLIWCEFYLSNKKFFVSLNELFSVPEILNCGVLQDSILELIFLVYVNNLF